MFVCLRANGLVYGALIDQTNFKCRKNLYRKSDLETLLQTKLSVKLLLQGDGWTLELNAGWTVSKGEGNGDYIVKKSL